MQIICPRKVLPLHLRLWGWAWLARRSDPCFGLGSGSRRKEPSGSPHRLESNRGYSTRGRWPGNPTPGCRGVALCTCAVSTTLISRYHGSRLLCREMVEFPRGRTRWNRAAVRTIRP